MAYFVYQWSIPCLPSGTDKDIQNLLNRSHAKVKLCQKAEFRLNKSIMFNKPNQSIFTEGHPNDERRAMLKIVNPDISLAISVYGIEGSTIENIQIDGNRKRLGHLESHALIIMGGNVKGQTISDVHAFDSRSWSTLHIAWGDFYKDESGKMRNHCWGVKAINNQLGPSGELEEGKWSDGISLQCSKSIIKNNYIVDVTDGGIVNFGSPDSVIENNEIVSRGIPMKIGIALVDYKNYEGNYEGVVVQGNTIRSENSHIMTGIAMGSRLWHCPNKDFIINNSSGRIVNNKIMGNDFGYGMAINGVKNWVVKGNSIEATFSGVPSSSCGKKNATPGSFVIDNTHSQGEFQSGFKQGNLEKIYDMKDL